MKIREEEERQVRERLAGMDAWKQPEALYFHTPFCGTCKVGRRMLEIAAAAGAGNGMPVTAVNINFAPRLREEWRIESVPCLVIVRGFKVLRRTYTMGSAGELFAFLNESTGKKE